MDWKLEIAASGLSRRSRTDCHTVHAWGRWQWYGFISEDLFYYIGGVAHPHYATCEFMNRTCGFACTLVIRR